MGFELKVLQGQRKDEVRFSFLVFGWMGGRGGIRTVGVCLGPHDVGSLVRGKMELGEGRIGSSSKT